MMPQENLKSNYMMGNYFSTQQNADQCHMKIQQIYFMVLYENPTSFKTTTKSEIQFCTGQRPNQPRNE